MQNMNTKDLHINGAEMFDYAITCCHFTVHSFFFGGGGTSVSTEKKITVCSESRSNVRCAHLKRSETIHVWAQVKYLALKYFGLDDRVVL